jgi:transposase
MVLYAGIDIGKHKHEVTFLTENGEQVGNSLVFDNSQRGMEKLLGPVLKIDPERVIFGLEATGHYWLPLYSQLTAAGYDVKVINPIQSDSLRNLYIRVTKNDRKDSFLVAEVLRFGRYTQTRLAEEKMIQLRELSRMRVEFQQDK